MKRVSKQKMISIMLSCTMGITTMVGGVPVYGKSINLRNQILSVTSGTNLRTLLLEDFEGGEDSEKGWSKIDGWQYDHSIGIQVATMGQTKALKLDLDYTGYEQISWSEAKISKQFSTPYELEGRNYFTMDVYYPEEFQSFSVKLFSNGVMDQEATILNTEDVGNGYKKAKIAIKFSATESKMNDLIVGIVSKNTAFKGSVYIDQLEISEYNQENDFVEITSIPQEGTIANISNLPTAVKITDNNAHSSAKNLLAYLTALKNNDQVLFGHENDYNKMVSQTATEGDVKEITGSLSGIYGIDTLSLTGAELGISDPKLALETSIKNSIEAAKQGALITLSAHMPNFTNDKITKNEDGTYNFTACDFSESKDLSNQCAEQILSGGAYEKQFQAYLDIIAEYSLALQKEDVPVLFRPFHENTGSWFWWGTSISETTYRSLYRYTADYLKAKGVHNILYVYSPNGPISTEEEYLERYPGDEYVDILAFDYYDDYNTYPATSDGTFFQHLDTTCQIISSIAKKHGKLSAISETGVRVMKADGSDNEGLLVKDNPVAKSKTGTNWYQRVSDIAKKNDMPYYLVWANFGETNFYVPYKYNETHGQEMINEFIDYYNDDTSVFADGTNFYGQIKEVATTSYTNPSSYIMNPLEQAVIKKAITFRAGVNHAKSVQFTLYNPDTKKKCTLQAKKNTKGKIENEYTATLTKKQLNTLGKTDKAVLRLVVNGKVKNKLTNISLGKEKEQAPKNVFENFDFYLDDSELLKNSYSGNSAAGCSSNWLLAKKNKKDGSYGGRFHYVLDTTGNEVWTGQVKTLKNNNFSKYNAMELWVKPDGKGQKLVVQIATESGEEFEVYLTELMKQKKAQYVTIPFSSFKGKNGGTLDTSKITKFAIWCNSIVPEGHEGKFHVESSIYFDGIKAVKASKKLLKEVNKDGLIYEKSSK